MESLKPMHYHEGAIVKEFSKQDDRLWREHDAREEEAFRRLPLLEKALAYFIGVVLSLIMLLPVFIIASMIYHNK